MNFIFATACNYVSLVDMLPSDFDCPKGRQILPKEGWKEKTYYIVEAAFSANNPIHRKIFFSGYLHNGQPAGYNCFATFGAGSEHLTIEDAYFIKVVREIALDTINVEAVNP